jgi:3'-phosphoadenosine 5'-phosphosulfate sulfotransferase (PAPS reductase)/FAD synthetase
MDTSITDVTLSEKQCNFCDLHDSLEKSSKEYDWTARLKKIRKGKYNCLIGISGGLDSSLLLEYTVKKWKLNPLVIHFDNGWNVPEANHNIETMVNALNVDFIRYSLNREEYDELCLCFLLASVSDADIPNDMAMAEMMLRTAKQYGIKYIFNGHNFRTEGSSPLSWSYMDAKYIQSVYEKHNGGKKLKSFPLLTFWKQLYYTAFCGIRQERPFYYMNIDEETEKQRLIKEYGWQDYGGKHGENIYTDFIGSYYLPVKFGIDKRITYNSALIRSGKMVKTQYLFKVLPKFDTLTIDFVCARLGITRDYFDREIMLAPMSTFEDYKTYHKMFKRYKWFFYVLTRMHLLPQTFYIKYCR